nr:MAG TPA: hypothetical protein [Caudoviricetes sp.]
MLTGDYYALGGDEDSIVESSAKVKFSELDEFVKV